MICILKEITNLISQITKLHMIGLKELKDAIAILLIINPFS